jgi:hypothetical protein
MNVLSRIALVFVAGITTALFVSGCGCDSSSAPIEYRNGNVVVDCTSASDCPYGSVCAIPAQAGCDNGDPGQAGGTCVMPTPMSDSCVPVQQLACDCSNVTISWQTGCAGLPDNTAPAFISSMGPCQ